MAGDTKSNADLRRGRQPARKLKRKKVPAGNAQAQKLLEGIGREVGKKSTVRVRVKKAPQLKKAAAVTIARSGERNSRKLPVVVPRSKNERDAMVGAVAGRRTRVENRTAGEAVRALNDRSLQRRVLADPKLARRVLGKDAVRAALASSTSVSGALTATPVTGRERAKAIKDLTSGKTARIKAVGPFTRKQLEDEGAVKRFTKNAQLPGPLRSVRYEKTAKKGTIRRKLQDQVQRSDPAALKALDIVARPFYAGAAATKAAAEGKDVGAAAKRGITGKERASYRDALKAAGAPKVVSDVVGTAADFIIDPVNLVSGGAASTARKAGEKAAKDAAKKGASEAAIRKARLEAMRAVEAGGKNRVGLDLKVAGKSVPAVRRVLSKKVNIERERKRVEAGRNVAGRNAVKAVNPRTRPAGVAESEFIMNREASTSARAFRDEALNETRRISRSAAKNVPKGGGAKSATDVKPRDVDWTAKDGPDSTLDIFPEGQGQGPVGTTVESRSVADEVEGNDGLVYIVARDTKGRPIGFYSISTDTAGRKVDAELVVAPGHRRKGVAEAMFRESVRAGVKHPEDWKDIRNGLTKDGLAFNQGVRARAVRTPSQRIIDAIEVQDFTGLPKDLAEVSRRVDKHLKVRLARRKEAGLDAEIGGKVTVDIPAVTADVAAGRRRVKVARQKERGAIRGLATVSRSEGRGSVRAEVSGKAQARNEARIAKLKTPELRDELFRAADELEAAQVAVREARKSRALVERRARETNYRAGRQSGRAEVATRGRNGAKQSKATQARLSAVERREGEAFEATVSAGKAGAAVRQARTKVRLAERQAARVEARREDLQRALSRRGDLSEASTKAARNATYRKRASANVRGQVVLKRKERVAAELEQKATVVEAWEQRKAKRAAEQRAARYEGMAEGYVPHLRPKDLAGNTSPGVQGGSAFSRSVSDFSREDLRPIKVQNAERLAEGKPKKFEDEDLPLLLAASGSKEANTVGKARFNKQISEDAPAFRKGSPALKEFEGAYYFDQGELRRLTDADVRAVEKGKHADKKIVRLDDAAYQRFVDDLKPLDRGGFGIGFDKANAAWKRLALATPGFYVRNLIGEATMGYMGTSGARGTARYTKAGLTASPKVLRRVHQREQAELASLDPKVEPLARSTKTVRVAGKKVNLDDHIDQARADGVLRKGQQGNELRELQDGLGDAVSVGRQARRAVVARERAHSFAADIEDVWRYASYKANLDEGMSRQAAARKSLDFHFDYGELSRFERQARRVLPFYTFNARALEMYTRSTLTNPKKLSAIEKSRMTVQDLTGGDENWRDGAKEYQERQVPIIGKIGGKDLMVSAGLPVSVLNELPIDAIEAMGKMVRGDFAGAAAAAKDQTTEWFLFSMGLLTPFVKAPVELSANHSYFFRGDIESEGRRLVAAPDYLKPLKGTAVGDMLGLAMIEDKRTGNMVLGFRGKADYLLKQIPGIPAILNRLVASGTNRRGQDPALELIAALTGINADPVDKAGAAFESLYDEREKVDAKLGDLRQQDRKESAEYKDLSDRKKELDELVGKAKIERGDADAKPKKKRVRKKSSGGGGGGFWGSPGGSSGPSSAGSSSSYWGG